MYKGLYAYAWDFVEEGTDEVLERVRAAGLNTVNVAMSYHVGKFLRPRSPARKVAQAKAPGASGLAFYNYGFMRLACLEWIREALI